MPNTTATVGNGGRRNGFGVSGGVRLGWPTERWVGIIVLGALAVLILIRLGFRGIGVSTSANVSL